jgi:hypothetical protein
MGSEQTMRASVAALLQPNIDFSIPIAAVGVFRSRLQYVSDS